MPGRYSSAGPVGQPMSAKDTVSGPWAVSRVRRRWKRLLEMRVMGSVMVVRVLFGMK